MKNAIIHSMGLAGLMLLTLVTSLQASELKVLSIKNPEFSNGIKIGDVINRSIEVEVDSNYQLPKTSLPIKGENHNGIELRDISVQMTKHSGKNVYAILLSYQVFASAAKPVVMALPAEHLALSGGEKPLSIDIPKWQFWFSPSVAEGVVNAKENLQPQAKPTLLNLNEHTYRLYVYLALLLIGMLGLVYINADKRWLPFMNGEFAQAHRNIKKLKNENVTKAKLFGYMHQAFNNVNGANLFASDLDTFLASNPKFEKLRDEIKVFFEQSNEALFATQNENATQHLQNLILLSKRLRDCERGV